MPAVVTKDGIPLMPTSPYRARKLLKKGRAEVYRYEPFTIRLLDRGSDTIAEAGALVMAMGLKAAKQR